MFVVGITGADGFLAFHLRALLHRNREITVRLADRASFRAPGRLAQFASECDAIVHLAGLNRGADEDILQVNEALADQLVRACDLAGRAPRIVFANSTHIQRETSYAVAKRLAAERLARFCERTRQPFSDLILPNVFGEFGRPFYNSVVATFCHQLAMRETPRIIENGEIELLHAQDAAQALAQAATGGADTGRRHVRGTPMRVSALLDTLIRFDRQYRGHLLPDTGTSLDLALFNTYRSHLFPQHYPVALEAHRDARGALIEGVRSLGRGQCFFSTTRPGIMRGNHLHTRKFERFLVVEGSARIELRRLFDARVTTFDVSGDAPCYIDMPTFHTHRITNIGARDLLTLFWANEIFDPDNPDTYPEVV